MQSQNRFTFLLLIAMLFVTIIGIGQYNGLIRSTQSIEGQFAQIETQYQRRFDLIPNLQKSVEANMKQEQKVFGMLAEARSKFMSARSMPQKMEAMQDLDSGLGRLIAVAENYPELKSSDAILALMDELSGTENRISVERQRYNKAVQSYNNKVKTFPGNVFAYVFSFEQKSFFQSKPASADPVEINISP